jgi:hypothetical protein
MAETERRPMIEEAKAQRSEGNKIALPRQKPNSKL